MIPLTGRRTSALSASYYKSLWSYLDCGFKSNSTLLVEFPKPRSIFLVLPIQIEDSNFYGNQRVCRFAKLKRKHSKVYHSHANWSFNQTPKSKQNHRHSKENQTQHDYSAIFQIKPCVCLSLISDTIPRRNVIYFFSWSFLASLIMNMVDT